MRNTKSAFTLVELIVVITILAILGTIAFISLQGYSADARNSKRTSDLGSIQSAVSLKQVEGVSLNSFMVTNSANVIATPSIAWNADASASYDSGTPSYTVLNVAEKDFKDPNDQEYRIAATTLKGGAFQISATLEIDNNKTALVNGTYVARGAVSVVLTTTGSTVVTVWDSKANFFKVRDIINTLSGASVIQTLTIDKVSRDGVTLTLSAAPGATETNIQLALDEVAGLIGSSAWTDTALTPVVNDSTTALAY